MYIENSSWFNLWKLKTMENYGEGKGQSLDGKIFSPGWASIKQSRALKCTTCVF